MEEEIERLVVSVRADTAGFARDVASMRGELEGPLAAGVGRAGQMIENSLTRAITTGKLGFDDLKRIALSALAEIAAASVRSLFNQVGGGQGGLASGLTGVLAGVFGLPGRAHGGPVSDNRPYLVGERGPELFVPTSAGRVETLRSGGRDVRISLSLNAPRGSEPEALRQSSRQIARALRSAVLADQR